MTVKTVLINQINEVLWSELTEQSSTATWFQTIEAYRFFESLPDIFSPFVYGVITDDELKGICVGYITREKNALKQYLTRRAIIIGGPMLADDISDDELTALLQTIKNDLKHKAIYIETRNFNDYSRWKEVFVKNGYNYLPHLNFHLDCSDELSMIKRMSESKVRQIKKSIKNGTVITEAENEEQVKSFYDILEELYSSKVKTPLFPESFFLNFYRNRIGKYFIVIKDNHVIGGIMCPILSNKTIYEWFVAGLDKEYKLCYPSILSTYSAMKYGADHGFERFDFMGAGEPGGEYGVRDFKAKFGGKLVEHGRFLCVNKPLLYNIGRIGVKVLKHI